MRRRSPASPAGLMAACAFAAGCTLFMDLEPPSGASAPRDAEAPPNDAAPPPLDALETDAAPTELPDARPDAGPLRDASPPACDEGGCADAASLCPPDDASPVLCQVGIGACQRSGWMICNDETGDIRCDANPGQPQPERCNGRDDDCDGEVDNLAAGEGDCTPRGRWAASPNALVDVGGFVRAPLGPCTDGEPCSGELTLTNVGNTDLWMPAIFNDDGSFRARSACSTGRRIAPDNHCLVEIEWYGTLSGGRAIGPTFSLPPRTDGEPARDVTLCAFAPGTSCSQ